MTQVEKLHIEHRTIENIFHSLRTGIVYYDQNSRLCHINQMARQILRNFQRQSLTLYDFILLIYDYSVDTYGQNEWDKVLHDYQHHLPFLEVIQLNPHHYYLVRIIGQNDGSTLVELSDISEIKNMNKTS